MTAIILAILLLCRITEPAEVRNTRLTPVQKFAGLFAGRGYIFVILVALAAVTKMTTWLGLNVWLAESSRSGDFSGVWSRIEDPEGARFGERLNCQ